jgi:hypothetical protein
MESHKWQLSRARSINFYSREYFYSLPTLRLRSTDSRSRDDRFYILVNFQPCIKLNLKWNTIINYDNHHLSDNGG